MPSRLLAALALLLLSAAPALADEPLRRVVFEDGSQEEGRIVERGDGYILLEVEDGEVLELDSESIARIEVLSDPGPRSLAQPRFDVDWAQRPRDPLLLEDWERRLDAASTDLKLGAGLAVPVLGVGLVGLGAGSLAVAQQRPGLRVGMEALGAGFMLGSLGIAFASAAQTRRVFGLDRDDLALRIGLGLGVAGTAFYAVAASLSHAMILGEIPSLGGVQVPVMAVLVATGGAAAGAGLIVLLEDNKVALDLADREVEARRRRASAAAPELASLWLGPSPGGAQGGLTLRW